LRVEKEDEEVEKEGRAEGKERSTKERRRCGGRDDSPVRLCITLLSALSKPKVIATIYSYYQWSIITGATGCVTQVTTEIGKSMIKRKVEEK